MKSPAMVSSNRDALTPPTLRRYLPLLAVALAMALAWSTGWHKQLTVSNIAAHHDALSDLINQHPAIALLAYVAIYVAVAGLSLPGGTVITLTGGLLFGWLLGAIAAVVGATAGATVIFLIARTAINETLTGKAGPLLTHFQAGFQRNAMSYLLFLRLVPAFPFWAVNLVPALLGVPLGTYVIATFIGIMPGTLAIASVGAGLDAVIIAAKAGYAACMAASASPTCELTIQASALINTQLIAALVLLGVIALLPVFFRKRGGGTEVQ